MAAIGIADSRRMREIDRLKREIDRLESRPGPMPVSGPYSETINAQVTNMTAGNGEAVAMMRAEIGRLEALSGDELIRRFAADCA